MIPAFIQILQSLCKDKIFKLIIILEIFSDYQPRQVSILNRRFEDNSIPDDDDRDGSRNVS